MFNDKIHFSNVFCIPNNTVKCLPALIPYDYYLFHSASKYKLSACAIPKCMSTIITSFMCLLHDEKSFREANLNFTNNFWNTRFCINKNENKYVKDILNSANTTIDKWKFFSIVRDPLDRFLSAFVHFCVTDKHDCYGCKNDNVTCVLEKTFQQAQNYASGEKDFNGYPLDMHIFPQNWYVKLLSGLVLA
uniref:Sulfotransferase n=1 Tax=Panagrolaimus davidi TaxID=227884 RepID=A0A914Q7N7_9BILA